MKREIKWFRENLNKSQIHGSNILAKLQRLSSLSTIQRKQLQKVIKKYREWENDNSSLRGYSDEMIKQKVEWLNGYKNEIENIGFSAQSKFHSSVIEEFLYYLFRDLLNELNQKAQNNDIAMKKILLGGIRAYSNLYFAPENLVNFIKTPNMKINVKDQDFAIYRTILIKADGEQKMINVPVVSVECKTYIDKTMLEGSIATAEKIKNGNPYCLFLVVTEWYDVSYEVDPAYSRIDQIYVLRKQKRRSNKNNPIYFEVVRDLFNFIMCRLERSQSCIDTSILKEGKVI